MSVIGVVGPGDGNYTNFVDFKVANLNYNQLDPNDWFIRYSSASGPGYRDGFALYKKPVILNLGSLLDIPGGYSINGIDRAGSFSNYRYKLFIYPGISGEGWAKTYTGFDINLTSSQFYKIFLHAHYCQVEYMLSIEYINLDKPTGYYKPSTSGAPGVAYWDNPSTFSEILPSDEECGKTKEALDLFSNYRALRFSSNYWGTGAKWLFDSLYYNADYSKYSANPGFLATRRDTRGNLVLSARNIFGIKTDILNVCPRPWTGYLITSNSLAGLTDDNEFNTLSSLSGYGGVSVTFTYIGVEKVI